MENDKNYDPSSGVANVNQKDEDVKSSDEKEENGRNTMDAEQLNGETAGEEEDGMKEEITVTDGSEVEERNEEKSKYLIPNEELLTKNIPSESTTHSNPLPRQRKKNRPNNAAGEGGEDKETHEKAHDGRKVSECKENIEDKGVTVEPEKMTRRSKSNTPLQNEMDGRKRRSEKTKEDNITENRDNKLNPTSEDVGKPTVDNNMKETELEKDNQDNHSSVGLKKELGLVNCVGIIVGNIIGTGIFVSPRAVLQYSGSVGMSLLVWVLSGVMCMVGAFCYAELGTMIPQSGGDYAYLYEAYGSFPAFIYLWTTVTIVVPGGRAVSALTFANYVLQPFFPDGQPPPDSALRLVGIALMVILTYINYKKVRWATRVQDLLALTKVFALIVIIVVGVFHLFRGTTQNYEDPMEGTTTHPALLATAFYQTFYAYRGWDHLNSIMEELKDPSRNMPRAIAISVTCVIVIYTLTNVAYFAVLPKDLMLASPAVAVVKMARSTRKQTELFLLAQPLEALSQIVLPTGEDVLRRLFCHGSNSKDNRKAVIDEVVRVWERAHIPVVPLRSIMKKLETLVGKYEVRKKAKKRQSEGDKVSDALLQGHLASLFDIAAPATSSSMIHLKQKDKDFLDDQRGQRKMVMSTVDKESMAKESRKHERLAAERRRKEKELAETLERGEMIELVTGSSATAECADSSTSSSDTNSSARGSAAASASRPKRLKITKEVAAAADRVKLTSRGAHHVFSAIAADQGVLSPSTSSIRRHRKVLRKETAEAAVKDYRNQVQEHDAVLILHWDGKLLPGSESQGHVDRLAIVVTSPSLEGEKLLAIPALPSGTGEAMASKVEETIRHWKFEDRVGGLCFDTTASNTGVHAGCCTLLEQKLGRPLLNLACRHHVMELILASAFKATFGDATSGPDVQLFKRFQKKWPTLIKANATIINDPRLADHDEWKRTTLEALAKAAATTRNDYKELAELTAKAIKGEVPTTFRKPGAHHYARWMAKAIYTLKMTMFKNEFELTPRELRSLQEMSVFIILIYARAWFEAPLAADAPFNDLTLFHDLHKYRDLNSKISEATVKTFKRHFWYLGTDLVGLALFSDKVTIEEKTKMVEKLAIDKDLDKKRWMTAPQDPSSVTLSDLVTKESLFSFTELKLDASFLQSPVLSWKENEAYNQGKETVQHLAVTNDPAERAIKLITDYSQILTKDESDR